MSTILDNMLNAERRDFVSRPMNEEEAMLDGYGNSKPGTQWSIVGILKEEIEMELAVFGNADPMELYYEKEHYLDHPELMEE